MSVYDSYLLVGTDKPWKPKSEFAMDTEAVQKSLNHATNKFYDSYDIEVGAELNPEYGWKVVDLHDAGQGAFRGWVAAFETKTGCHEDMAYFLRGIDWEALNCREGEFPVLFYTNDSRDGRFQEVADFNKPPEDAVPEEPGAYGAVWISNPSPQEARP